MLPSRTSRFGGFVAAVIPLLAPAVVGGPGLAPSVEARRPSPTVTPQPPANPTPPAIRPS